MSLKSINMKQQAQRPHIHYCQLFNFFLDWPKEISIKTHKSIWNVAAHVFVKAATTLSLCELGRTGMLRIPPRMTLPFSFQISRYSKICWATCSTCNSDVPLHINSNTRCLWEMCWIFMQDYKITSNPVSIFDWISTKLPQQKCPLLQPVAESCNHMSKRPII